jgi:hypothetical protein
MSLSILMCAEHFSFADTFLIANPSHITQQRNHDISELGIT